MKHATDADHLAAVATLASGRLKPGDTVRQGSAWGIGHSLTLMLFCGFVLALGKAVPPVLEQALELAVALMLIVLGLDVLRRLVRQKVHFHVHNHGPDTRHIHAHGHAGGLPAAPAKKVTRRQQAHGHLHAVPLRAPAVGMMHGMAGSAALILLSLDAVESFAMGFATHCAVRPGVDGRHGAAVGRDRSTAAAVLHETGYNTPKRYARQARRRVNSPCARGGSAEVWKERYCGAA